MTNQEKISALSEIQMGLEKLMAEVSRLKGEEIEESNRENQY
jgi:hypothetical protein